VPANQNPGDPLHISRGNCPEGLFLGIFRCLSFVLDYHGIVNNWAVTMSVRGRVNGETWPGSNRPTALVVDSFQQALSVLGTCWDRVDLRCCESRTAMQLRRMGLIEVTDGRPRIRLTEWT
jgi:hypothetical protein